MTRKAPKESAATRTMLRYLNGLDGAYFEKRHGGPYGTRGRPDITGTRWGMRYEFEVKRDASCRPSANQKIELGKWLAAGAVTAVVRTVVDVRAVMEWAEAVFGRVGTGLLLPLGTDLEIITGGGVEMRIGDVVTIIDDESIPDDLRGRRGRVVRFGLGGSVELDIGFEDRDEDMPTGGPADLALVMTQHIEKKSE